MATITVLDVTFTLVGAPGCILDREYAATRESRVRWSAFSVTAQNSYKSALTCYVRLYDATTGESLRQRSVRVAKGATSSIDIPSATQLISRPEQVTQHTIQLQVKVRSSGAWNTLYTEYVTTPGWKTDLRLRLYKRKDGHQTFLEEKGPYKEGATILVSDIASLIRNFDHAENAAGTTKYYIEDSVNIGMNDLYLYLVPKAGVTAKVKVSGEWVDGDIKCKVNGEWVDADAVYVKINDTWIKI